MNSVGKYIRFIFKNLKAFRASKRLYEIRTHLALANMEISKISLHDQLFARRVEEFNEVMIVLTTAKWKTACAMEAATKADAQKYWKEAFSKTISPRTGPIGWIFVSTRFSRSCLMISSRRS